MYNKCKKHNLFIMAPLYLILALVIQGSFTYANVDSCEEITKNQDVTNNATEIDDQVVKDFESARKDWMDFLLLPDSHLFPTSSVALMKQATDSEKSVEEQLEDIKEIAQKITLAIRSEMANLLSYALSTCDDNKVEEEDNNLRKKRSTETPMASTQLITRLLKHIKSNNEYQNIAIDKMMTAQEIAEKYGIEFSPDTEIISDLAFAANKHAKDMTNLLHETLEMKNSTRRVNEDQDNTCPAYAQPEKQQTTPVSQPTVNHHHHSDSYPSYNYYYNYPYETQIPAPAPSYYSPPVTKRPNFYDAVSYSPDYYPPYCAMEPVPTTTTTTVILPFEEIVEPEPELVGEEFEETVTSKVYVDRGDEPGSATVNHVMTYTVAEKSHFKTPEIEKLPQQMQYCFFLI